MQHNDYILTLACPDTTGIVYHVSGFLFERGCNIQDSQQFGDEDTQLFFLRVHFSVPDGLDADTVRKEFAAVGERFSMQWQIRDPHKRARVLLMVSKHGHCLNDLLFRAKSGQLPIDIPAVVSNHPDFALLSASYGVPFYHLPVAQGGKEQQERQVLQIAERENVDLVVLARYMQILSPEMCRALAGRAINIHHSFLPSFKGARPYYQAHDRGVKLIGATAHYVTPDLDEGPIIEQDIARVDHSMSPEAMTQVGRDVECLVLARAVRWHVEHRILLNGHKTIVFA
ncbi:MAG: formyltetrahydrofolate deformylase [Bordetella sp. SCN 67-23]|nr:formyltetrahydrofolate deformylase [Burkholderiales bacterium]ODS74356.1 MAG: formyltetrahydrofolate deformylase [Bordetella sp. SCN 67-23]ODU81859.1 MAG: formyltetrahydrofolate deformylase [Bordetella sp. SCN 68-11]OJW89610.1 MAG: formyltetrahydrofolate deformylase [Burkholderiales bacterium 67-32]